MGGCGGGFMQHPKEASRLRLVLLNMERGHTAKAAGSFWLAANVAIQAGIGGADAARHHVVGTKPFWTEAKQRGTDIKTHTRAHTYVYAHTHMNALKGKHYMQLNMHLCIAPPTHTRAYVFIDIYLYLSNLCCFDTCQEKTEFVMLPGSSSYTISSECVQLKGKRVNFLNFSILF